MTDDAPTPEQMAELTAAANNEPAPDDNKPYGIPEEGDDE